MSREHEISLLSAANVIKHLSEEKYNVIMVGITKSGQWMRYRGSVEDIKSGAWSDHPLNLTANISQDRSIKGLIVLDEEKVSIEPVDVVIPVLHGKNGEDGKLQGLLEISGIPFVGCGTASSANCMDKVITDIILRNVGIKKANLVWFYFKEYEKNPEEIIKKIELNLKKYPLFVKPSNSGSSVGISHVKNREELKEAIFLAAEEDHKILVEESIDGKELECAVLGNKDLIASVVGEIEPLNGFYDYNAKYLDNTSALHIPARIDDNISDKIREIALKAYKTMGCTGLARIDFFLRSKDNEIILNEINSLPGFTDISMYPKLMDKMKIPLNKLLDKLISLALERDENDG
jgi:D-alanine-D-alanine ligase